MNVIIFHVFEERGDQRVAAPALSPDERVVLWPGIAPASGPEHPSLAPIVVSGDLDGRPTYAEQIPRGLCFADMQPPDDLLPWVLSRILDALGALHAVDQIHGEVGPERIFLGSDGGVVLTGRGRRGGLVAMDVVSALSILHGEEDTLPAAGALGIAEELAAESPADATEQLAAWVRQHLPPSPEPGPPLALTVSLPDGGMDEVVPDLGPDVDGSGILDRWSVTTGNTAANEPTETTAELGAARTPQQLAIGLWSRLAAPRANPSPSRFDATTREASRGVRALLADEPPDVLPVPLEIAKATVIRAAPSPASFQDEIPTQALPAPVPAQRSLVPLLVVGLIVAVFWLALELVQLYQAML